MQKDNANFTPIFLGARRNIKGILNYVKWAGDAVSGVKKHKKCKSHLTSTYTD